MSPKCDAGVRRARRPAHAPVLPAGASAATPRPGPPNQSLVRSPCPVEMTRLLVRTPSVNPELEEGGAGEAGVAAKTAEWLRAWGCEVAVGEAAPGRCSVVARKGRGAGPSLLLSGHLDTVGVAGMTEPFSGELRDGKVHGRGAADMKAGVACILAAAAGIAGEELEGQLVVALTADEEHAAVGMEALLEGGLRADAAVVCEPTSLAVMPAHKGFLWIEASVAGCAAHGSRPDVGVDAVVHAGHLLVALDAEAGRLAAETGHPLLGPASVHAGLVRGGSAPSVYAAECRLVVERRTLPGEGRESVMAEMARVVEAARRSRPGLDAKIKPGLFRAGTEADPEAPAFRELRRACARAGLPDRLEGMSAWVEAGLLNASGTPAVCFGPGSIAQAHAAEEWVSVSEIRLCARVLEDFARRFLAG